MEKLGNGRSNNAHLIVAQVAFIIAQMTYLHYCTHSLPTKLHKWSPLLHKWPPLLHKWHPLLHKWPPWLCMYTYVYVCPIAASVQLSPTPHPQEFDSYLQSRDERDRLHVHTQELQQQLSSVQVGSNCPSSSRPLLDTLPCTPSLASLPAHSHHNSPLHTTHTSHKSVLN